MARRFQSAAVSDISGISWVSNGSHTVACWMYVTTPGGGGDGVYGDVSTNGSQSSQSIWIGCNSATQWEFQEDGGTYDFTTAASTNTWTHLALTYDGTNCRAYINGSLVNTGTFNVGTRAVFQYFDTGFTSDMHSQDCVVFNRALSQVEIAGLMRLSEPPMDSLFLWWPMLTGAPTLDYSGKRNNWTSDGSTAATTFPPSTFLGPGPRRIWQPPASVGAISGSAGIQSAASGSLSVAAAVSGSAGVQSAAAGTLSKAASLAGSAGVQVAASGTLSTAAALSGAGGVQSAASGTLNATASLAGSAGIQSAASGTLTVTVSLVGAAGIQSAASGSFDTTISLTGAAGIQSAASGSINGGGGVAIAGASGIQSAASGTVSAAAALGGAAGVASAASGVLSVSYSLTGSGGIQSAASGAISGGTGPTLIPDPDIADRRWLGALGARRRIRR